MKYVVYVFLGIMLVAGPAAATDQATELKTETEKLSYALGLDLGAYFKSLGEDFDLSMIQRGIDDSFLGKDYHYMCWNIVWNNFPNPILYLGQI